MPSDHKTAENPFSGTGGIVHALWESNVWEQLGVCQTFQHMVAVEARLRHRIVGANLTPFPPPPFPGRAGEIEPIRDYGRLVHEGDVQRNCALTYLAENFEPKRLRLDEARIG